MPTSSCGIRAGRPIFSVVDPDYTFTNAYGLRWDAPRETAYPSTFVIDRARRVRFAHISHTHGDRVSAQRALDTLASMGEAAR
jgi:peroxiredoxin